MFTKTCLRAKHFGLFMVSFLFIFCCIIISGCGKKDSSQRNDYYEVTSETERLFTSSSSETLLGMQYFQGGPVQLRTDRDHNIFLVKADGTSRQLLEGFENASAINLYMDREENLYWWSRDWTASLNGEEDPGLSIHKLDSAGNELWATELDPGALLIDICQLPGGHMALLLQNPAGGVRAAEIDPETGILGRMDAVMLRHDEYIGAGAEGLLVMDTSLSEGISEVNLEDGTEISSLPFGGGAYSLWTDKENLKIMDFRLAENQEAEILWADPTSGLGIRERLTLTKIDKIPIIIRATLLYDEFLKQKIAEFNQSNEKYHVVLEYSNEYQEELGQRTAVEMATGGGPDILYGYILEYLYDLIDKGGFEDLTPYMESSQIMEKDYFPFAFLHDRKNETIYAVRAHTYIYFSCVNKAILDGRNEPDIHALTDALMAWEGDATIYRSASDNILCEYLTEGSEDYWGMVDWENGTCDFSGELFAKMLQIAKRYGYTWEDIYAGKFREVPSVTMSFQCNLSNYKTPEELESMGMTMAGTLFEDGCHLSASDIGATFAINANSGQKEGAWEFIQFMISEKNQLELADYFVSTTIVNRKAYQAFIENMLKELEENPDRREGEYISVPNLLTGKTVEMDFQYARKDFTEERINGLLAMLEDTRDLTASNIRKLPIRKIISEEAQYYFNGSKSIEEVTEIINNRVGLYLQENH